MTLPGVRPSGSATGSAPAMLRRHLGVLRALVDVGGLIGDGLAVGAQQQA